MGKDKKYTLNELKKKLTEKEKKFCHEYVMDWNGSRAARAAGYSKKTAAEIAHQNLIKLHIKQYIDFIKTDYEMLCGITKAKQINELRKIAYSSIAHLHDTWVARKDFETLTDDQKDSIQEIETKIKVEYGYVEGSSKKVPISVEYVKVKLYDKKGAIEAINKMMGYNEPDKVSLTIDKITGMEIK